MSRSLPEPVLPMLATSGPVPEGEGWSFEWKWDGIRAVVAVGDGQVRAISRNARDITSTYPELYHLADLLPGPMILDGELVSLDADGRPDFGRLHARMHNTTPSAGLLASTPVLFYVFDLLQAGQPLYGLPYRERRELLDQLQLDDGPIRTPDAFPDTPGPVLLDIARQHGLEGVIAKRTDSRYEPATRVRTWIKTPLRHTQEVVVCGWNEGAGRRAATFGALLLGIHDHANDLHYAGMVGTGFTDAVLHDLLARLRARETTVCPFVEPPPREHAPRPHWVRPELVGEVEHRQWSADGRLRHPSWRGLRPDRDPTEIRRD